MPRPAAGEASRARLRPTLPRRGRGAGPRRSSISARGLIKGRPGVSLRAPCWWVFKRAGPQSGARVFFRLSPVVADAEPSPPPTLPSNAPRSTATRSCASSSRSCARTGPRWSTSSSGPSAAAGSFACSSRRRARREQALSTRDAAVNLELCANVSRDLSPALDVVDLIPHAYQLEVSSPGVERPLRTERDFVRFAGHKAKLKRRLEATGSAGDRVVVGLLDGVADGRVRVVDGTRTPRDPARGRRERAPRLRVRLQRRRAHEQALTAGRGASAAEEALRATWQSNSSRPPAT